MALPIGCSEFHSAAAARARISASPAPGCATDSTGVTDTTRGAPTVRVPVLSSTTVSTVESCSRWVPSLTKAPQRAARAIAARTARGVPAATPQAPATMMTEIVARTSRVVRKVMRAAASAR